MLLMVISVLFHRMTSCVRFIVRVCLHSSSFCARKRWERCGGPDLKPRICQFHSLLCVCVCVCAHVCVRESLFGLCYTTAHAVMEYWSIADTALSGVRPKELSSSLHTRAGFSYFVHFSEIFLQYSHAVYTVHVHHCLFFVCGVLTLA